MKGQYMFTTSLTSVRRAELSDDQIRTFAPSVFTASPLPDDAWQNLWLAADFTRQQYIQIKQSGEVFSI
jgi:hypothetical protein